LYNNEKQVLKKLTRLIKGFVKEQESESYPIADSTQHRHGEIVRCPSCGAVGCLDSSPDGGLSFENGIWEEEGEWFCVECCRDPLQSFTQFQ
jgi:hypothetical protein